jgi:hypothetical protein
VPNNVLTGGDHVRVVNHGGEGARGTCADTEDSLGENCRQDDISDVSLSEYHDSYSYCVQRYGY